MARKKYISVVDNWHLMYEEYYTYVDSIYPYELEIKKQNRVFHICFKFGYSIKWQTND